MITGGIIAYDNNPIWIFNTQERYSRTTKAKLYSARIRSGTTLVRDFIPVSFIESDGVTKIYGLLDLVEGKFYGSEETPFEGQSNWIDYDGYENCLRIMDNIQNDSNQKIDLGFDLMSETGGRATVEFRASWQQPGCLIGVDEYGTDGVSIIEDPNGATDEEGNPRYIWCLGNRDNYSDWENWWELYEQGRLFANLNEVYTIKYVFTDNETYLEVNGVRLLQIQENRSMGGQLFIFGDYIDNWVQGTLYYAKIWTDGTYLLRDYVPVLNERLRFEANRIYDVWEYVDLFDRVSNQIISTIDGSYFTYKFNYSSAEILKQNFEFGAYSNLSITVGQFMVEPGIKETVHIEFDLNCDTVPNDFIFGIKVASTERILYFNLEPERLHYSFDLPIYSYYIFDTGTIFGSDIDLFIGLYESMNPEDIDWNVQFMHFGIWMLP